MHAAYRNTPISRSGRTSRAIRNELAGFMKRSLLFLAVVLSFLMSCGTQAGAADAAPPAYSGDFLTSSTLTDDWGGLRGYLATRGVTFVVDLTQFEQGVVAGGKTDAWQYGRR